MAEPAEIPRRPPATQVRLGGVAVTVLCDGFVETGVDVVVGIDTAVTEDLLSRSDMQAPLSPPINVFLLDIGGRRILSDVGAGASMGALAGHLVGSLAAIGLEPSDIDTVLLTHIHPDHSNGLVDPNGLAIFERAEVVVAKDEYRFWVESDLGQVADRFHRNMTNARRAFAPYRDRLRLYDSGEAVPGIVGRSLPGHTPGHTGWQLATGNGDLLLWGDIVHLAAVQIPRPEAGLVFDVDAQTARTTRAAILAEAADADYWVAGAHLPFPGLGKIMRHGNGYRVVADTSYLAQRSY